MQFPTSLRLALFLALLTAPAQAGDDWGATAETKLKASDASSGAGFGEGIDVSGDRAVVSRLGALYVYERSGGLWSEVARITASGTAGNQYGHAVAISGDYLVAGAWLDDTAANDHGAAFVYERDASGTWGFVQQLTASDAGPGDHFGWSIDMDGDTILVGSDEDDHSSVNGAGSAYVYRRLAGVWTEEAKLVPGDPGIGNFFGWSVSVRGDLAAAGTLNDDVGASNTGSAYVFRRTGTSWVQESKLVAGDLAASDSFGYDVACQGERVIVGSPGDDDDGAGSGSTYVFRFQGGSWVEAQKLHASAAAAGQGFGRSVALDADLLLVGAHQTMVDGKMNQGALHLFALGASAYEHAAVLHASDGELGDFLGRSVALDGARAVASAHGDDDVAAGSGAAYVFDLTRLFTRYCSSSANSTGNAAGMTHSGSSSIAANDLVLAAEPVPDQPGLFVFGDTQADLPFGNGRQCVAGPFFRLGVHLASGQRLEHALDLGQPPALGQITSGSTWHFQALFRDPQAGGAFFDSSDGLSVLFVP